MEVDKVKLLLGSAQVQLILDSALALDRELEESLTISEVVGSKRKIMLSLHELDDLEGHVAAAANHCSDKKIQSKLDTIVDVLTKTQQKYNDV